MHLSDFDYHLPPDRIAQHPLQQRDSSKLMILNRQDGSIKHACFKELLNLVNEGDTLVFNDSRVIPARLRGSIEGSVRKAEILLLKSLGNNQWEAMVKPGNKLKAGTSIIIHDDHAGDTAYIRISIVGELDNGIRIVQLPDNQTWENLGETPLPPYIKAKIEDPERYQTVYSHIKGSAAAPTAGLHFTPQLLDDIKRNGVNLAFVTLHVGLDTFQPVRVENPQDHHIHSEYGRIDAATANLINETRKRKKRVITVGTTATRLVEAAAREGSVLPFDGPVDLFILPGYKFQITDCIITNFHLPRSTLLMMISAFAGREFVLKAYQIAQETGYRFYSFGDAMLIL